MSPIMKTAFEAVAIRYVHDARNGEFLNIGVVVFAPGAPFAGVRFLSSWGRITAAFSSADAVLLRRIARSFEKWSAEWTATIGELPLAPIRSVSAFVAQVLHQDDSSIQVSPPISGVTSDPQRTLNELFELYADRQQEQPKRPSRDDSDVWKNFAEVLNEQGVIRRIQQKHIIRGPHYEYTFENAWKNGKWNVAQPLSLDLLDARTIREKATSWFGRVMTLRPSDNDAYLYFLVGMPGAGATPEITSAAADAIAILSSNLRGEAEVITEDHAGKLAQKIFADLAQHPEE